MDSYFKENVSTPESMRRFALGFLILGVFLANPGIPAWVTLIALYPLTTALVQWDPVNAVFERVISNRASNNRGAVRFNSMHKA